MKFFLVALVAFTALANGAYLPVDNNLEIVLAPNKLVQLIRDDLNIFEKILNCDEPFQMPDILTQHITGKDIDLNMDFKEVKVCEADEYIVDYVESSDPELAIDFHSTLLKVHLEGQYKASGVVRQARINGAGNFNIDIDKVVLNGTIQFAKDRLLPKVIEIEMNYDLEGVECELEGLSVEEMIKEEMIELVNTQLYKYLQSSKKDVCDVMSKQLVQVTNKNLEAFNKKIGAYLKLFHAH